MPLYEYQCTVCATRFERLRPFSQAHEPLACPDCGGQSRRLLSVFTAFSATSSGQTQAIAGAGGGCSGCAGGACASCAHGG
ncbi:MAG: zinc ribbon domain-containing protein [Dehalococcoidia bacterium]|nr:zinc ribbon domain-containing protein [Dehalococcoidia bacterium]MDW8119850.1 zinc ribbon domain-containing protein [Chloroflexota bacterium]